MIAKVFIIMAILVMSFGGWRVFNPVAEVMDLGVWTNPIQPGLAIVGLGVFVLFLGIISLRNSKQPKGDEKQ